VTLAVRILNQGGDLVARMEIVVLWRREPQPVEAADELSPIQDGRVLA
jgi:hypothetical protein